MQAQANAGSATHPAVVEVAINGKVFKLVQDSLLMKEQHAKLQIMSPATGTQEQHQLQYKFNSLLHDPLKWGQAAAPSEFVAMKDMAHDLREVKETVKRFYEAKEVVITGVNILTVAQVAAVARRPEVRVVLDLAEIDAMERSRIMTHDISSNSSSVVCHRQRSQHDVQTREHHVEPRISTPGVFGESSRRVDTGQLQSCIAARAAMLVRTNTLMQLLPGFSGKFRWEILEAMEKLLNAAHDVTPMLLPERGSGTISSTAASGRDDQVATFLSYIAGLPAGRPDQFRAVTENVEKEVSAIEDLRIAAGVEKALGLQPKELGSLTQLLLNGSNANIGSATLASTVCFDANVLVLLAEVLYDLFCELIMPRKPDQFAAAADPAIFTLGPQIECIRNTTHSIQREINSLNDNPIIDAGAAAGGDGPAAAPQLQYYAVGNNNIEGTRVPIGVSMDNLRLAIAGIGKSMFTQFSELISNEVYYNTNSRFPYSTNVSRDPNSSASLEQPVDYDGMMNKGAEIAMASYLTQLNYLADAADPVKMEQTNQDNIVMNNRSSLDLVSARKTEEVIEILKLMSATFLVASRYCTSSRRMYTLYNFVRSELAAAAAAVAGRTVRQQQQQLLPGGSQISTTTMSPELQDQIHKIYNAISEGRVIAPLLDCIQGWTETQAAGPFAHVCC